MDNASLIGFLAVIVSVMSLWISLDSLRRARKMEKENKRLGDFSKATNALLGIDRSAPVDFNTGLGHDAELFGKSNDNPIASSVLLPVDYVPGQSAYQTLANHMSKENSEVLKYE